MNRSILIQVTAPAVLIGLILLAVCLVSARHVNQLQANLATILASHVSSMEAAQRLEVHVRQLRFHSFLYLMDPDPLLLKDIANDEQQFEDWLIQAERLAYTSEEIKAVQAMRVGYDKYQNELEQLRLAVGQGRSMGNLRALSQAHPIRHVLDPCREYARLNEVQMNGVTQESTRVSERLHVTMFLLGICGPIGGLLSGFGIARGLSRSLYRLSVRVQDMAQRLERDVGAVKLTADGDFTHLDQQLQHVVQRVAEVTQRLQRQQQEILRAQQLAAVGQLAASVAHEVRNPLTSIKLLVEVGLRNQNPKPFTRENLQVVHAEILRLQQTVQSFLDFARPPALVPVVCDLRAVVQQALELVRARARQQKVQLATDLPPDPLMGQIDRGQLCTVLVNLFINALDAMPSGGRLTATLSGTRDQVRLTVRDTGEGISPDIRAQLFTPFVSTKATGSGLGLSISRRIIEEHGGRIDVVESGDKGACFAIVLPVEVAEERHAVTASYR